MCLYVLRSYRILIESDLTFSLIQDNVEARINFHFYNVERASRKPFMHRDCTRL